MEEQIILGNWTIDKINNLLLEASAIHGAGPRIDFLSGQFLHTKYKKSTLVSDKDTPEVFVINLEGVDCLTFIEYIEAMRRSKSFAEFKENLKRVRYRYGMVAFKNRNHFFTDWKAFNSEYIVDITSHIRGKKRKEVSKRLNEKHDGSFFVPGVSCRLREVVYIPSTYVDDNLTERLKTGDYVGIYSKQEGLDVSHTGIIIKDEKKVNMRHASSVKKYMKVIDEDLIHYLKVKPGIIVLRPRD